LQHVPGQHAGRDSADNPPPEAGIDPAQHRVSGHGVFTLVVKAVVGQFAILLSLERQQPSFQNISYGILHKFIFCP
jgi:hypothetical protein